MAKKKVCKSCKIFVEGEECPVCKSTNLSLNWQGRLYIVDPDKSVVALKVGLKKKGEYAIKVK
jgi:DNA-directed RNA polymerase subunit E"